MKDCYHPRQAITRTIKVLGDQPTQVESVVVDLLPCASCWQHDGNNLHRNINGRDVTFARFKTAEGPMWKECNW